MCLSIDQLVGIDGATRNITEPMLAFIIWRTVPQGLQLTWGSNSLTKVIFEVASQICPRRP